MSIDKIGVGRRLLELRKCCGISRETVALKSGISERAIRHWESGEKEIRIHNLQRYLEALESFGCYTQMNWILHGSGITPNLTLGNPRATIEIMEVIEILKKTSNFFYYLDSQELAWYINQKWLYCLRESHNNNEHILDIKFGIKFDKLCSSEVYKICHEHYLKCIGGQTTSFTYAPSSSFNTSCLEATMLYIPAKASKNNEVVGVFAFLLSQTPSGVNDIKISL